MKVLLTGTAGFRGWHTRVRLRALTTAGNPWTTTEVRRLLSNGRHTGIRVHNGVEVGDGVRPAILTRETRAALQAVLSDPARHQAGRPSGYLLLGVATCSVCGGKNAERLGVEQTKYLLTQLLEMQALLSGVA